MRMIQSLVLNVLYISVCSAALYQRFEDVPNVAFDFVIIGGGTAGSVLANRLTEDQKFRVLIIEGGPSNEGVLNSMVPFNALKLSKSQYDWNFTTVPQVGLNGRSVNCARGHLLGGSSSTNGMFYTRGSSSDYDRWAAVTKDAGWSWNNLLPYILKNERWTNPADNHPTTGQFNPRFHSDAGKTFVSLPGFPQAIDGRVIQAAKQFQAEFSFNQDINSGDSLGLGWLQSTIGNGQRSSAATSYLPPSIHSRSNLYVVLNTFVTRILRTGVKNGLPDFRTVELVTNSRGTVQVTAKKELILSAGSIATPRILMSSGIGDQRELTAVGIKPVVNMSSVGKNLTDHPLVSISWFANSSDTLDTLRNNATLLTQAQAQWNTTHTGPFTTQGVNQVAYLRVPSTSSIWRSFSDPASGRNAPHYELTISNGGTLFAAVGDFVGAGAVLVSPISRGTVSLSSTNPLDAPLIDPAYFTSDFDILTMREALKSAMKFFTAPAWKNYVIGIAPPFTSTTTDVQMDQIIRNTTISVAHPVGTAAMSAKGASYGVVDPDLRVKQMSGLRIVDASVMPFVIAGHTQAAVYAIAERAADLIKSAW